MSPPISHAAKTSVAEPTARAMSLVTRKTPVPMVSPMTIAAADQTPRPRIKSECGVRAAGSGLVLVMEAGRAYYRWRWWSTSSQRIETRNSKRETRNTKYEMRNAKYEIRNAKCEMRNAKCEMRCTPSCDSEERAGQDRPLQRSAESAASRYHRGIMAMQKSMISEYVWDARYAVSGVEDVMTPALVAYPEFIASNIERTLELLGGDADRWRVHIKTAKLGYTVRMMVERGIRNFKCATTLELLLACQSGAADVLLAYPSIGANARRVRIIAEQFPAVRVSVLVDNEGQLAQWRGSRLGVFVDINPGMNRTGIEEGLGGAVVNLARAIGAA